MKAKPVIYQGNHFRSKTEARWYIFMKKLGWNVEYEPEIPGLYGWLPDFVILGPTGTKTLVEVKPFKSKYDFESDYAIQTFKKINDTKWYQLGEYKERDVHEKEIIHAPAIKNYNPETKKIKYFKNQYDAVLVVGSSLAMSDYEDGYILHGGTIIRPTSDTFNDEGLTYYSDDFSWIDYPTEKYDFGVCDIINWYQNVIEDCHEGSYGLSREGLKKLERYWNESWTELRWKGREVA